MTEKRTYIDANMLIAAWNGDSETRALARAILDDPKRCLVTSDFVRLEVLPKPAFHRKAAEIAFMETILSSCEHIAVHADTTGLAVKLASEYDLHPLDALHVAVAASAGVDEIITLERPEKPLCCQEEVPTISLRARGR